MIVPRMAVLMAVMRDGAMVHQRGGVALDDCARTRSIRQLVFFREKAL